MGPAWWRLSPVGSLARRSTASGCGSCELQPVRGPDRRRRPGFFRVRRPDELWHMDMTKVWTAAHGWVSSDRGVTSRSGAATPPCRPPTTGHATDRTTSRRSRAPGTHPGHCASPASTISVFSSGVQERRCFFSLINLSSRIRATIIPSFTAQGNRQPPIRVRVRPLEPKECTGGRARSIPRAVITIAPATPSPNASHARATRMRRGKGTRQRA